MEINKRIEEQFYDLLSARLSGDASVTELSMLQKLIDSHPSYRLLHDQMIKPIGEMPESEIRRAYLMNCSKRLLSENDQIEKETHPQEVQPMKNKMNKVYYLWAAVILLFLATAWMFTSNWFSIPSTLPQQNELSTKVGSKSKLILPDGSTVILNGNSKLTYGSDFNQRNREVYLTGEGYFDVTSNKAKPFIIHTAKASVKVLGTIFAVKNYPNENRFETSLLKGQIEVTLNAFPEKKIRLKPSQKLIIRGDSLPENKRSYAIPKQETEVNIELTTITKTANVIVETSWVEDKMVFSNISLEEIVSQLENKFDIKVVFLSDQPRNYRYTGVFNDGSLEEIMKILKLSKEFNYRMEDQTLLIDE